MSGKRRFTPSKNRIRNLTQYKDMTDDEFEDFFNTQYPVPELMQLDSNEHFAQELKERVKQKIEKLGVDYDLSDMKSNDMMQLESLALAIIQLEDLELFVYKRREFITDDNIFSLEKVNKVLSDLRADISKLSSDLQLTRKIRNESKDVGVAQRWEELTKKAYEFYREKMLYIFCPNCKLLLSTLWLLYTTNNENKLTLHCEKCGNIFEQKLNILFEQGNKNLEDVKIP